MNRSVVALVFGVIAFLTVLGGSSAAPPAGSVTAAGSATFIDPAGDANGAPDITTVELSDDGASEVLTIAATVSGMQPHSRITVSLNTDRTNATGDSIGAEYRAYYWLEPNDAWGWHVERWEGKWQEVPLSEAMSFDRSGDVYTWTLGKQDIGGTSSFSFGVNTALRDASHKTLIGSDRAGYGKWIYYLWTDSATPPVTTPTAALRPVIGRPVAVPAKAVAGGRMTVRFPVTRSDDGTPLATGKMTADPSVAGKLLRHAEQFKNGLARLSFDLPKSAKGKLLKVRVTIKLGTQSAARVASFRVT